MLFLAALSFSAPGLLILNSTPFGGPYIGRCSGIFGRSNPAGRESSLAYGDLEMFSTTVLFVASVVVIAAFTAAFVSTSPSK